MAVTDEEKRVPVFDWQRGDFLLDLQGSVVTVTQAEAVEQIVIKAQQTVRGAFLIYANLDDPTLDHVYGNDAASILTAGDLPDDVRMDELKRAAEESLIYDPWITAVEDIVIKRRSEVTADDGFVLSDDPAPGDEIYASFTVQHIFGATRVEGVNLSNG